LTHCQRRDLFPGIKRYALKSSEPKYHTEQLTLRNYTHDSILDNSHKYVCTRLGIYTNYLLVKNMP
jgi:hypothetical protein